jgi:hypothetical protein
VELYLHSPIRLHGVVLIKKAQGRLYLYPVLNEAPLHEDVLGSGGIAPGILTSALDGSVKSKQTNKH